MVGALRPRSGCVSRGAKTDEINSHALWEEEDIIK